MRIHSDNTVMMEVLSQACTTWKVHVHATELQGNIFIQQKTLLKFPYHKTTDSGKILRCLLNIANSAKQQKASNIYAEVLFSSGSLSTR